MSDPYAVDHRALATPLPTPLRTEPVDTGRVRRRVVWALVLGVVGVGLPVCSVVALVLGHSAAADSTRLRVPDPRIRALAVAAIVLGWVGVAVMVLLLAVMAFFTFQLLALPYAYS